MTTLPPSPFLIDSALVAAMPAETAAAPDLTDPPVAAAESFESAAFHPCAPTTAAAGANAAAASLGDIGDVHEIFHHARLLIAEDNAVHRRFVLDEARFVEAIEPPPLFLQRAIA